MNDPNLAKPKLQLLVLQFSFAKPDHRLPGLAPVFSGAEPYHTKRTEKRDQRQREFVWLPCRDASRYRFWQLGQVTRQHPTLLHNDGLRPLPWHHRWRRRRRTITNRSDLLSVGLIPLSDEPK